MQFITISGLVIRSRKQGDSNKILKIASVDGLYSALCYNCNNPKSQLLFLNEPFVFAEFQFKKSKGDGLHIHSATLLKNFYNLRFSLEKIKVASEICQIIEKTIFENIHFPLNFVLNTLAILENADEEKIKLILPFFTLRYLKEIGFSQETDNELINHIQFSKINRLYNIQISKNTLNQLAKYAKNALSQI